MSGLSIQQSKKQNKKQNKTKTKQNKKRKNPPQPQTNTKTYTRHNKKEVYRMNLKIKKNIETVPSMAIYN